MVAVERDLTGIEEVVLAENSVGEVGAGPAETVADCHLQVVTVDRTPSVPEGPQSCAGGMLSSQPGDRQVGNGG